MTGGIADRAAMGVRAQLAIVMLAPLVTVAAIFGEAALPLAPWPWLPDLPAAVLSLCVLVAFLALFACRRRIAFALGLLVVVLPLARLMLPLSLIPELASGRVTGIEAPAWVLAGMSLLLLTSHMGNAARLALCLNGAGAVVVVALPLLSVWLPLSLPGADGDGVMMPSSTLILAVHASLALHALARSRATPSPNRQAALLIGTLAAFAALASGVWSLAIWRDLRHTVDHHMDQAQSIASTLEEHSRRSFGEADLVAKMLAEAASEGTEPLTSEAQIWRVVRDAVKQVPQIGAVSIVDAQGTLHLHTSGQPAETVDLEERDYFRAHLGEPRGVFVGQQAMSWLQHVPIFPLSRALTDSAGRFSGVVVASLRVEYFRGFFRGVALPAGSMIGLYRRDGDVLAREPATDDMMGRSVADCVVPRLQPALPVGSAVGISPMDGVRRLMSYRFLPEFDIFVVVGIPWADVVEDWAMRISGYGAALLALLAAIAALAWRQLGMIAQQQATVSKLEASEQRYRAVVQDQTEFISRCTADGIITFANEPLCRNFAERIGTCVGQPFLRLLPDEDHARVLDLRCQLSPAKPVVTYECSIRDVPGETRWHEWTDRGIFDQAGRLLGLQSVGRDITLRKQAETALREGKAVMKHVIDTLPDALVLHDADGRVMMANLAAAAMFGSAVEGASWYRDTALPEARDEAGLPYPISYSARFHRHDGADFLGEVSVRPLHSGGLGAPGAFVTLVRDVSAAAEATRFVQRARSDAEAANAAKTRFLAVASHDLRQPLHATNLFIDSLARRIPGGEARELVADAQKSLESLEEMFGHLLDMCRLEAGVVPPQVIDVPVSRIIESVATQGRIWARNKGLRFTTVACSAVVATDPVLLERILRNLVVNAVRYTHDGGIVVGCRRRGSHLLLEVWDSGRGIPEDELDNVFLEFYRLAQSGRRGLGLGLTIVKRLADVLGHSLSVQTRVGRGSMFRLGLPLSAAGKPSPVDATTMLATGDLSGVAIALLDDDGDVLRSTAKLFADWGCHVWPVRTPEELARVVDARPDILVTDYELGGTANGLQVAAAFRQRYGEDLPVLIITGDTHRSLIAAAKAQGCRVLHKPLRPSRLRSMVALMVHADEVDVG